MDANSTLSSSGGTSGSDNVTLRLTYAAIGLSVGAIFLSTLQALLAWMQFDMSEVGSRRCSSMVMGEWASETKRSFSWRQLRFEVTFAVPVFYTAPPGVIVGPIKTGEPTTTFQDRFRDNHDADFNDETYCDERAVGLEVIWFNPHYQPIYKITGTERSCENTLCPIGYTQSIKYVACSWNTLLRAMQKQEKTSRAWDKSDGLNHEICYFIQKRRRLWDGAILPLNVTMPYAETTISHLVKMISMLGLVWTEFDVKRSILRAEGNGYIITSEHISSLGIMTRFLQVLSPEHEETRIIPCNQVKSLCFGEVPSILDSIHEILQVSPKKIELSLKQILPQLALGHRRQFLEYGERPLMFPSIFEFIAMVAKSCHLPGSRFRRLPNPCAATWTPLLDVVSCLKYFATNLESSTSLGSHVLVVEIQQLFQCSTNRTLVQKLDSFLSSKKRLEDLERMFWPSADVRRLQEQEANVEFKFVLVGLLDTLHRAILLIDERLTSHLNEVKEVLTHHFAAIFDNQAGLNSTLLARASPPSGGDASSDSNERKLVEFYFAEIHPVVCKAFPEDEGEKKNDHHDDENLSPESSATAELRDRRSGIWVALVFRMFAWLVLHDFNPDDVMLDRSEFKNSSLPVYIW